jgi:hypothetical protein
MKNVVSWDVALYSSGVNRRFGGTYRLHLQGRKIRSYIGSEQSETECRSEPNSGMGVDCVGSVLKDKKVCRSGVGKIQGY